MHKQNADGHIDVLSRFHLDILQAQIASVFYLILLLQNNCFPLIFTKNLRVFKRQEDSEPLWV